MEKTLFNRQRLRKTILFLWLVVMPITFNWMSPVLIIFAGFEGYLNLSFLFFAAWFVSSLFLGRAYCAYACQWGASQEIFGDAIKKPLDPTKKARNSKIKYPVFVVWVVSVFLGPILLGGYAGVNIFFPNDAQSLVSFEGAVAMQLVFYLGIHALFVIMTLVAGNRSFCRYACPMGVLGIIGSWIARRIRLPSLHLEANTAACISCKQCTRACVMSLDVQAMVQAGTMQDPDCILCGSCVDTCPQAVISYAWKWKRPVPPSAAPADHPA